MFGKKENISPRRLNCNGVFPDPIHHYIKANLLEWLKRLGWLSLLHTLGRAGLKSSSLDNKGHITNQTQQKRLNPLKTWRNQYGNMANCTQEWNVIRPLRIFWFSGVILAPHAPPVPEPHSLELPFSRVCVVTVVKICERRQDLLEERTQTRWVWVQTTKDFWAFIQH